MCRIRYKLLYRNSRKATIHPLVITSVHLRTSGQSTAALKPAPVESCTYIGLNPTLRAPDQITLLASPNENIPNQHLKAPSTDEFESIVEATVEGVYWYESAPYKLCW